MPVRDIPRELEALAALRGVDASEASRALRKALRDKVNVVVAKAAKVTAELQLASVIPELCVAFERLLVDPVKSDPKCWGKEAIAKALKDLGHAESAVFVKGSQHVQSEPVWGGEEDTATTLRATCALALLDCSDLTREDKLWPVMRLLTERSASLRKDGAVALESLAGREAALLLRIKARMGDEDSTVTGQVFESLLRVEGETAVPFLVEFLRDEVTEVREEAALALGASRLARGVEVLKEELSGTHTLVGEEVLLRALSISRHEEAIGYLLELVARARMGQALAALEALKLYRDSSEVRGRIESAVASRSESELRRGFESLFGQS